jgi:phosphoribosylanthranilate isomerase
MDASSRPRVKICCIGSAAEARLAIDAGASALGLVGPMPSGPGVIPDDAIAAVARRVPPPIATFLLTSEQSVEGIAAHHRRVHTTAIQIVDRVSPGTYADLRGLLPGVKLVQVVHVTGEESVKEAAAVARDVDALLLDSGRPDRPVKELGGTGRRHDWRISKRIREEVAIPVYLAGGLDAGNVREAIDTVGPFALDVCSGVRTDGRLDPLRLRAFFDAAGFRESDTTRGV